MRCVHESQMHENNCFITLTYDQLHLPIHGSLDVKHWQLFAKRVRKKVGKFRFFHCGEYGDKTMRPHYHALLFGVDFTNDPQAQIIKSGKHRLWRSPQLDRLWGKGHASVGALVYETARYVASYAIKKSGLSKEDRNRRLDRLHPGTGEVYQVKPEYTTMSRRPGLGASWQDKYGKTDLYPQDNLVLEGRTFRPPRFYDERTPHEIFKKAIQRRRAEVNSCDTDHLRVRETVQTARTQLSARNL